MEKRKKIESKKLLLVEGNDEVNFFEEFIKYINKKDNDIGYIQILNVSGINNFKNELNILKFAEGFNEVTHLGIIRDAEQKEAIHAFNSIKKILKDNNLSFPENIKNNIRNDVIKIGIFIIPDNLNRGMLEDLCLCSIKNSYENYCIEQFIDCVKNKKIFDFNESKAKIQTYLAIKKHNVNSLGIAAKKGYWDFENKCFNDLKEFIIKLYED